MPGLDIHRYTEYEIDKANRKVDTGKDIQADPWNTNRQIKQLIHIHIQVYR